MNLRYTLRALSFFVYCLFSVNLYANNKLCEQWVDSVFSTLTLEEKIGQLFVYNTAATNSNITRNALINTINSNKIGGILFWNGTIKEQAELTNLAQETSKVPLFITLDGEWGLNMRLKNAIRYPQKLTLAAMQDELLIYDLGVEMGRQCNEMDIHINFDPVLDVNLNPKNPVINTRAFGDNPIEVTRKALAYIQGLQSQNILPVGKHFPGHGDTSQDSHHELARVTHSRVQLDSLDLYPFKQLMAAGMNGIMIGHLSVPVLDPSGTSASLSSIIINDLLKREMGFKGLVFTDAMKMKAVANLPDVSVKALSAGNDIILDIANISKEISLIKKAIDENRLSESVIDEKCKKVLRFKYQYGVHKQKKIDVENVERQLNSTSAVMLQRKLAQSAITLLRNNNDIIPIKELKDKKIVLVTVGTDKNTKFEETLSLYCSFEKYIITKNDLNKNEYLKQIKDAAKKADLLLLDIHHHSVSDNVISDLCSEEQKVISSFFISPYRAANYPQTIKKSDACLMAYENMEPIKEACAQAIFGGIEITGLLPVSIGDLFEKGDGISTKRTRLSSGVPEEVGLCSTTLCKIDSIANDAINRKAMPGCQILVAKEGVVIYQKSFGHHQYDKKTPVANSDVYDLASVTKVSATLLAVMKLYDEGKIELNEKASTYLPSLKKTDKENITISDLLFHQSGMPAYLPLYQAAIDMSKIDDKLFQRQYNETYCLQVDSRYFANKNFSFRENIISTEKDDEHPAQIAENMFISPVFRDSAWNRIVNKPLVCTKKYIYSDLNFIILQRIVEKLSKEPLDEFCENNFYSDLGTTSLLFNPKTKMCELKFVPTENDKFLRKQLLSGYVHDANSAFLGGVAGHAGLFGNANDLAKLFQMIINNGNYGGVNYLSEETCQTFTTAKSDISRRGLGFDRNEILPADKQRHPRMMYGHYGFTGTGVWIDPQHKIIYVFLSNRVHPESWNKKLMELNIRSKIEDVIYESIL